VSQALTRVFLFWVVAKLVAMHHLRCGLKAIWGTNLNH
jgi:hypothetical protein